VAEKEDNVNRKVYDCFCYFNEDMLLELRLETLWDYVDYFVISEASYSHRGEDRDVNFDIKRFSKYMSKIRYLRLDERPIGKNDFWKNENFIRDNLINGLFDAEPDDLVLISDLDEIPNPENIFLYDPNKYLRGDFCQSYYSYFFNNHWLGDVDKKGKLIPDSNIWLGSKITTYQNLVNFFKSKATSVRSYKSSGPLRAIKRAWFKRRYAQIILNGGWHFTWIFPIDDIIKKLENTAHQEFNKIEYKDKNYIKNRIYNGMDFIKKSSRYQRQIIDNTFPQYLQDQQKKYADYILPPHD